MRPLQKHLRCMSISSGGLSASAGYMISTFLPDSFIVLGADGGQRAMMLQYA